MPRSSSQRHSYSYNKGPYRLKDVPSLVLGAAAISGGIYVIVRVLLEKKQAREAREAKVTLPSMNPSAIQDQSERGHYR